MLVKTIQFFYFQKLDEREVSNLNGKEKFEPQVDNNNKDANSCLKPNSKRQNNPDIENSGVKVKMF